MRELDVLLTRYHAQRYPSAPEAERSGFARLLEREDPEIWAWLMSSAPAPAEFADVIRHIRGDA